MVLDKLLLTADDDYCIAGKLILAGIIFGKLLENEQNFFFYKVRLYFFNIKGEWYVLSRSRTVNNVISSKPKQWTSNTR